MHGPKPRSHAFKLNKKVRRLGLKIVLSARAAKSSSRPTTHCQEGPCMHLRAHSRKKKIKPKKAAAKAREVAEAAKKLDQRHKDNDAKRLAAMRKKCR